MIWCVYPISENIRLRVAESPAQMSAFERVEFLLAPGVPVGARACGGH